MADEPKRRGPLGRWIKRLALMAAALVVGFLGWILIATWLEFSMGTAPVPEVVKRVEAERAKAGRVAIGETDPVNDAATTESVIAAMKIAEPAIALMEEAPAKPAEEPLIPDDPSLPNANPEERRQVNEAYAEMRRRLAEYERRKGRIDYPAAFDLLMPASVVTSKNDEAVGRQAHEIRPRSGMSEELWKARHGLYERLLARWYDAKFAAYHALEEAAVRDGRWLEAANFVLRDGDWQERRAYYFRRAGNLQGYVLMAGDRMGIMAQDLGARIQRAGDLLNLF